jgi:hypothetical protein
MNVALNFGAVQEERYYFLGTVLYRFIYIHQSNENIVMHFSFNLLRIKGPNMFPALLAHPQEATHKGHLVYCMRANMAQPTDIIHTQYTKCRLWTPPEDDQVMLETCRGPWFSIYWMKSASLCLILLGTMKHVQQNIKFIYMHKLKTAVVFVWVIWIIPAEIL